MKIYTSLLLSVLLMTPSTVTAASLKEWSSAVFRNFSAPGLAAEGIYNTGLGVKDTPAAIDRFSAAMLTFEYRLSGNVDGWLAESDRIIQDSIESARLGAIDVVNQIFFNADALVDNVFDRLRETIKEAGCEAESTFRQAIDDVTDVIRFLDRNSARIDLPIKRRGGLFNTRAYRSVRIEFPNRSLFYFLVEEEFRKNMNEDLEIEDNVRDLVNAYVELQEIMLTAECDYSDTDIGQTFSDRAQVYGLLQQPWINLKLGGL